MTPSRAPAVLVVGRFYTEAFALHIAETLQAMGHEVPRFETGIRQNERGGGLAKRWTQVRTAAHELARNVRWMQDRQTQRLLRVAGGRSVDLVLVCHDFLLPREVARLRDATGAPVVLWFPDAISNFTKMYWANAGYDHLFFKDPYVVHTLRRTLDRPVHYLPECCNPERHRPVALGPEDERRYGCDIATAGNLYAYRAAFFAQLADYRVRIWGNPPPLWMDTSRIGAMIQGRFVAHDEKARAFLAAKIVLNSLHPAEIWGINARAFEIAAVGGFQIIDWRPGLDALLRDGREVVSFRDRKELRAKLDHYLAHAEERQTIAEAGRERARREHTYRRRLELLVDTVQGRAEGFPLPSVDVPGGR